MRLFVLSLIMFSFSASAAPWQWNRFGRGAGAELGECGRRFQSPQLGSQLHLLNVDLAQSIEKTGLTLDERETLTKHSKGLIGIYNLIRRGKAQSGYLLGVTGPYGMYDAVSVATGLTSWRDASGELNVPYTGIKDTPQFMEALIHSKREIVFLVPPNLWAHSNGAVTKSEMRWLLDHPQALTNVVFVFGALDIVDDKNWDQTFGLLSMKHIGPFENLSFEEQKAIIVARKLKHFAAEYK